MPNIPPLISSMPDSQALYASYTQLVPDQLDQQGFAAPTQTITGSFPLVVATAKKLAETFLTWAFPPFLPGNRRYFPYVVTSSPSFSYTSTITTGTINFELLFAGAVVQSISSTPNTSSQTITFNSYTDLLGATNDTTANQILIRATATDAQTITTTNITNLWAIALRCGS